MPMPKTIEFSEGEFILNEKFGLSFGKFKSEILTQYSTRFLKHLANKTGLFFPNIYLDKKLEEEPVFQINVIRKAQLRLGENENYKLEILKNKIILDAETEWGAYRGLETLLQLLSANEGDYIFPTLKIIDEPRFPWRGLMIDVARHFMPLDVIKRNIDGMASVKLNVLHLHLADDQGFRVESKVLPKLQLLASDGLYFAQEEIREIVEYASKRGIRVVPEFDMPGHATSWIVAYPELASMDSVYSLERGWGIFDPTLNPIKENTYEFLGKFIEEMVKLFPDEYFHIGGDENNGVSWNNNQEIVAFKAKMGFETTLELQNYFNQQVLQILQKHGKKMIGWDEILVPELPKYVVIQSWRGKNTLDLAAKNGYQVLLSNGYYIDLIQPTEFHYLNDPVPEELDLTNDQEKMILGGEATMWAEYVSYETIDSRIWPRTAAIAERLWSRKDIRDVGDMYRRIEKIDLHLEEFGLLHLKNREMLLRRLANDRNIEPLKILISAIEPLKIYERGEGREYTSYSPLSRLVDASYPDPKAVRDFNTDVQKFIKSNSSDELYQKLKAQLMKWQNNHADLLPIIKDSPILKEIESLSYDLSKVAEIGLKSLQVINDGEAIPADWKKKSTEILKNCKAPRGESEIMIINSVQDLVNNTM
jgi:hexosaminidase